MDKLSDALKKYMIFLNSLDLKIEGNLNQNNYEIKNRNNEEIGTLYIDYFNLLKLSIKKNNYKIYADYNLNNPLGIEFYFQEKSKAFYCHGNFDIEKKKFDNNYFATINGTINNRDLKMTFAFNKDNLFSLFYTKNNSTITLLMNPKEEIVNVPFINYEFSFQGEQDIKVREYIDKYYTKPLPGKKLELSLRANKEILLGEEFYNCFYEEYRNSVCQIARIMKKMNPHYQDQIILLNEKIPWFRKILTLSLPDYSLEEVKELFGLAKEEIIYQNDFVSLNDIYNQEKLVRARK